MKRPTLSGCVKRHRRGPREDEIRPDKRNQTARRPLVDELQSAQKFRCRLWIWRFHADVVLLLPKTAAEQFHLESVHIGPMRNKLGRKLTPKSVKFLAGAAARLI